MSHKRRRDGGGKKRGGLTEKQKKFALNKAKGMNDFQAAVKAGYSESTARSTAQVYSAQLEDHLKHLVSRTIPADAIVKTLNKLISGEKNTVTRRIVRNAKGKIVQRIEDRSETQDLSVRLRGIELAAEWGGYFVAPKEPGASGTTFNFNLLTVEAAHERIVELAERIRARASDAPGNRRVLGLPGENQSSE